MFTFARTLRTFFIACARRSAFLLVAVSVVLGSSFALAVAASPPASADNWYPVHQYDFPDPSVMTYDGVYYAFATQNFASAGETINIQESSSADGVHWTQTDARALPRVGSWAKSGNTWAPSVAFNGSEFVMYYAATEAASPNDQCIGVATSSTPQGPFVDSSPAPIVCQNGTAGSPSIDNGNYGGSIDPDIFTDAAGMSSLIWKSDGNHIGTTTYIWSVPLAANLLSPTSTTPTELLADDESWQGGIVEAPDMYETETTSGSTTVDSYYLFYSGNADSSTSYAVGWASCPSGPSAACADQSSTPLFSGLGQSGMTGPGSTDVFTLPPAAGQSSGQAVMAFSAWQGTLVGYLSCGSRPMYEADVSFPTPGGAPVISDPDPAGPVAQNPPCSSAPSIVTADSTTFDAGQSNSFTVLTTGYPIPTLSESGSLPAGVSFVDNGNGTATLTGTPTQGGTDVVNITASNDVGDSIQPFTLTVGQEPVITSANTASFIKDVGGSFSIAATGYPTPTFSETGPLPAGVVLNSNGVLSGTPTQSGTFPITVFASNGSSNEAYQDFTLTVIPILITTTSLPPATIKVAYKDTLGAVGGRPPYSWTYATGSKHLPLGMFLSSKGVISGKLSKVGSYTFTVEVKDTKTAGIQDHDTETLTLVVQS